MIANPYMFGFSSSKAQGMVIISVITTSLMFPLISILMMKGLGLIESFEMKKRHDRIGPLIVTGLFFIWLFVNIRSHDTIPALLVFFVLGSTIGVFLALLFNNFQKISLHTIGAGGLIVGMGIILYNGVGDGLSLYNESFRISLFLSQRFCFIVLILLGGIIGTSRLLLGSHTEQEVYGGYIIGAFSQLVAYLIIF
jgi:hypothetical protein